MRKWIPEMKHHRPGIPVILVATQASFFPTGFFLPHRQVRVKKVLFNLQDLFWPEWWIKWFFLVRQTSVAVPSPSPALNAALVHGGCFLTSMFSCDVIFNNPITAFGTCMHLIYQFPLASGAHTSRCYFGHNWPCSSRSLRRQSNASAYTECSALTGVGVKDVFDEAVLAALLPRHGHDHHHIALVSKCFIIKVGHILGHSPLFPGTRVLKNICCVKG